MHKLILFEIVPIILFSSCLAIMVNTFRHNNIAWIPPAPYEIYVPCKEKIGSAEKLSYAEWKKNREKYIIVDARKNKLYTKGHIEGSINIPYDYLEEISDKQIKGIAKMRKRIAIYGDGDSPDSGHELALEISGKGIKNVFYIEGGYKAITHDK